ncbi:right-handed parallel beta-helix repeat-containing protein [Cellulomonas sp. URHE0023]|uniref:right-handed parallel beta-helix repeat-containing protein n=1 Tax=Cellulomonas sp. URHE0023 TaxID=1380354 RepID=UPI0004838803|nr:right-handed parallel beta-helix repeat-containing protein [Cellulomonas sp. URHE0023]
MLRADLVCAGPGLVLGPDVDLDLRGHTLRGTAGDTGLAVTSLGTASIKNGTLSGWDTALRTLVIWDTEDSPGPLTVDRVSFRDNGTGIDGTGELGVGAKKATVSRSTFTNNGVGLSAEVTTAKIDHTVFADNTVGVFGDTGAGATITDTRFLRNDRAILLNEGSAEVMRSTFIANRQGVASEGYLGGFTVADSSFTGSDVAVDGTAIAAGITGSTFVANTTAVQIGRWGSTVTSNTFRANQTTISLVAVLESPSFVQDNTFRLNGDGLKLDPADALLSVGGNDARFNAGWGIDTPGVTDLGGNTASHNGNQPQCVGVVCS